MVNENLSTKYILLNCLRKARESGTVVSGEIIAAECGISRTAVWKAVQALESFGYKISSDASGYLLQKDLEDSICPWEFGTKEKYFSYFQTTDSTMIQAQKVATSTKKISDVKVIVADKQTKGMGQHGRLWKTTKGSLAFTLVTKNSIPVVSSRRSVMACQIAIANVLSKISKRDFFVRWPNDVWSESGKVCGILDELCSTGGICSWQNLGIGVNVFTHPNIAFSDSVFPKQQKAIRRKIISDFIIKTIAIGNSKWI